MQPAGSLNSVMFLSSEGHLTTYKGTYNYAAIIFPKKADGRQLHVMNLN